MWIASKLGYFSVVKKGRDYHVRARVKRDLHNLLQAAGMVGVGIISSENSDYKYRVVIDREYQIRLFDALRDSIDYLNFKSVVAKTPDQRAKLQSYHAIWSEMQKHQA